jgi:hypothetical protein
MVIEAKPYAKIRSLTSTNTTTQLYSIMRSETISKAKKYFLSRLCKNLPLVMMRGPTQCTNCIKHNADNKLDSWTLQNCSAHLNPNESQGNAYEPMTLKEKGMLGYEIVSIAIGSRVRPLDNCFKLNL